MNKRKQQSPIPKGSGIGIAEKWKEIINRWKDRWKDIPPIDDSIAPWPPVEGLMKKINQKKSDKNKK